MTSKLIAPGALIILSCVAALSVGAAQTRSRAKAAAPPILSARGLNPRAGEASPEGRLLIGRGHDYVPIAGDPEVLARTLQRSMAQRRQTAWRIVEAMLEPQRLTHNGVTFEVPLWQTWYEGMVGNGEAAQRIEMFIAALDACGSHCPSRAEVARQVMAASPNKNLVRSLTPGNLDQALPQFTDPRVNPEGPIGHGFTLFSPSFLEHVLTEAQGIDNCSDQIAPDRAPPASNQFSPCISEFPRSAVMVKARWQPLDGPGAQPVNAADTSAAGIRQVIRDGTWIPHSLPAMPDPSSIYTVEATNGRHYGLTAIHFSTKDIREWIWITLWWTPNPNADFGQDRPASIANYNGGVWAHYNMCVTTAFEEGDPAPWSGFAAQPQLAAALRSANEELARQAGPPPHDRVTTWCSNPNVERQTGNGLTNCIGCHQYSYTWNGLAIPARRAEFSDTYDTHYAALYPQFGRSRSRSNFPAEFSWAFNGEFRPAIQASRAAHHFEWPQTRR